MGARPRNSTRAAPSRDPSADLEGSPGAIRERAAAIAAQLAGLWPDAVVELDHQDAYQLLVATILAAQSTDKMINTVTPALFARYPDAPALAAADQGELEKMIFSTGFYRAKARNVIGMARRVVEAHGGEVPDTMEGLVDLPGVARKTANVVLGSALGKNEGVVVDTHVSRLAPRLGLTTQSDPVKIEQDLMQLVPRDQWSIFAHRLIWHGRRVCHARKPDCERCTLAPLCPSNGIAGTPNEPERGNRPTQTRAQSAAKAKARAAGAKPSRATALRANALPGRKAAAPTAKPNAAKPNAAKPNAAKPNAAKPSAAKPSAAKPSAAKPSAAKPSAPKPTAAKPTAGKPTAPSRAPTPARSARR